MNNTYLVLAFIVVSLPASADAQAIQSLPADPGSAREETDELPCSPFPACAFVGGDPFKPPVIGGGGIIARERAPGFDADQEWGAMEFNPEFQQYILRRDSDAAWIEQETLYLMAPQ